MFSLLGVLASAIDSALLLHSGHGSTAFTTAPIRGRPDARRSLVGDRPGAGRAQARGRRRSSTRRRVATPAALLALAVVLALALVLAVIAAAGSPLWLYPYGLLLVDASVVVLISVVVLAPSTPAAEDLRRAVPLRWIGTLSYGIYLWHFPLFLWLDSASTGLSGIPLLALRLTITLSVSVLSFYVIERAVRQRRVPAWLLRPLVPLADRRHGPALLVAGAVETSGTLQLAAVPAQAKVLPSLRGTSGPAGQFVDTPGYGLAPLSPAQAAKDEPAWLVGQKSR